MFKHKKVKTKPDPDIIDLNNRRASFAVPVYIAPGEVLPENTENDPQEQPKKDSSNIANSKTESSEESNSQNSQR